MSKREFNWEYVPSTLRSSAVVEADAVVGESLYKVVAHHEHDPENPWEAWDSQPPMVSVCGRNFHNAYGDAETPETSRLTAEQVINNHDAVDGALAPFFECMEADDPRSVLELIFGNKIPDQYHPNADPLEIIRDEVNEYLSGSMDTEMLDRLEEVWNWLGVQTWNTEVYGYSQGDWCKVLMVATPEWLEKSGLKDASEEVIEGQLVSASKLYGHYMFGDTYWCEIVRVERDEDGEVVGEEFVESCGGYYGPDHEASGLADYAREVLDSMASLILDKEAA
jgi:hypothetical protein